MLPIPLRPVLILSALALHSAGALAAQSRSAELSRRSIQAGEVERNYLLHLPPSRSPGQPIPLLLVLHGGGGDGAGIADHTGLTEPASLRGYAVVYPDGIDGRWNDGRDPPRGPDDVAFIRLLLDSLGRELPVDPQRIYATGISNGAAMSYRLACDLPGTFAAIAPVAGGQSTALESRCAATLPVSLISFQGTSDRLMPYQGGTSRRGPVMSAPRSASLFARVNGCSPDPTITLEPDTARDGTRVRRSSFTGCRDGREVVLYTIEGGGHTWPGGPPVSPGVGRVTRDIDASRVMLDFFDRHARTVSRGSRP